MRRQVTERTGSESDSTGIRVPPPLIYAAAFVLGVVLELAFETPTLAFPLAVAVGSAGVVLWVVLDLVAMRQFQKAETEVLPSRPTTALVRTGPYRFSRNPMYLGMLILYAALALAFGFFWSLALLPVVFIVVDRVVIPREETYLERTLGDEYQVYRNQVRRWL